MTLERDDPNWVYEDGVGGLVHRRLRVWRLAGHTVVCVVTEEGDGRSITNAAENVYERLCAEYPGHEVTVVEHYPAGWCPEKFARVVFDDQGPPRWRYLSVEAVHDLLVAERGELSLPGPEAAPNRDGKAAMAADTSGDHVVFRGRAGGDRLVTVEGPDGDQHGPLEHHRRHSPGGFAWGYDGPTAADLALSLVAAALAFDARCVPQGLYLAFKREVVARWDFSSDWSITAREIRVWCANHRAANPA